MANQIGVYRPDLTLREVVTADADGVLEHPVVIGPGEFVMIAVEVASKAVGPMFVKTGVGRWSA